MKGLIADLTHGLRLYRSTPLASLGAVLVMAVGMAFVASFLSLYVDLVLRPHPGFERGSDIVTFGWSDGRNAGGLPYELITRIQEEVASLEAASGTDPQRVEIGSDRAEVVAEVVTTQFFDGVRPKLVLGRGFTAEDHNTDAEPVTVISYDYWLSQFDGDDDALGRTIEIRPRARFGPNGERIAGEATLYRVIGVMSPAFTGTLVPGSGETTVWLTVERAVPLLFRDAEAGQPYPRLMRGLGRRLRGAGDQAIVDELAGRFQDELATAVSIPNVRFDVLKGLVFDVFIQRSTQRQLELFLAASILLALVATTSVSLFLLARAPVRRRELGIRMAVGAPRKRLARQLASEAALLVLVGAVLGLLLSIWLANYLRGLSILRDAQWRDVTLLDWRIVALVGTFLVILVLLVSLAPIMGLKDLGIANSSRLIAARPSVAQRAAGAAQIAIAGTLAGSAVAFTLYLCELMLGDPGYAIRDRYAVRMAMDYPDANGVDPRTSGLNALIDNTRYRERMLAIPGVTGVSVATVVPGMSEGFAGASASPPDDPTQQIIFQVVGIDSHYVDLLDLDLLYGRVPDDNEGDVALVNREFAQAFFGRDNVVGEPFPIQLYAESGISIIGVLENLSFGHPDADITPMGFMAMNFTANEVLALIETTLGSAELREALQGLADSRVIEARILDVTPLSAIRNQVLGADRARSFLTIAIAGLVVILAINSFYGTQRYLVAVGRREFAIRASLGAGPLALGRLVFRRGLLLGLPGLCLALPLTYILVAWLRDDYVSREVSPLLVTLAVTASLLLLVAAASIGPARRARRTQPAPLLRED